MTWRKLGIIAILCALCLQLQASAEEASSTTEGLDLINNSTLGVTDSPENPIPTETTKGPSFTAEESTDISNEIDSTDFTPTTTTIEEIKTTHLPESDVSQDSVIVYAGEECKRTCVAGDRRICKFTFVLENYQAMGLACGGCEHGKLEDCENRECILGDGFQKGVMSINRRIPGPDIQVCKDDLVVVDVENMAAGTAAAIHWHGIHMQQTPWMDGVPFVTQCPIPFATTFRYQFPATEPGTQFYHSHSGHHKIDGQYGALIVRQPIAEDPQTTHYDYDLPEHYILLSDWMHGYAEDFFPGLPKFSGIFPDALLINGRGRYLDRSKGKWITVPPTRYYVKPGKRYRFRVINSISNACPAQLQVENHTLSVISSDSYDVEPRPFDSLVTNAGERYDFILDANQPPGDYWIRLRGMGVCGAQNPVESFALLRYTSNDVNYSESGVLEKPLPPMPSYTDHFPPGVILNHPNASCFGGVDDHCVTELRSLTRDEDLLNGIPDQRFFLAFNNYPVSSEDILGRDPYPHFANLGGPLAIMGAINNLSLVFPDYPPLTQPHNIEDQLFCDDDYWPEHCRGQKFCPCVHILQVKRNSLVELVVVDESKAIGRMHHPFHIHGYKVAVVGLSQHPEGIPMTVPMAKSMERRRTLIRNVTNPYPPYKDTVTIPSRGYAIFRFRASNPGFWLLHCHYELHLSIGMGLIVQVGNVRDMVPPPADFPKCGNYKPDIFRRKQSPRERLREILKKLKSNRN